MSSMDDTKPRLLSLENGPTTGHRSAPSRQIDVVMHGGRRSVRGLKRGPSLCRLAPQAFNAVLLVERNLACQRQSGIEAQMGDRCKGLFTGLLREVEPADDAPLVAGVADPGNRTGRRYLGIATPLEFGGDFGCRPGRHPPSR